MFYRIKTAEEKQHGDNLLWTISRILKLREHSESGELFVVDSKAQQGVDLSYFFNFVAYWLLSVLGRVSLPK